MNNVAIIITAVSGLFTALGGIIISITVLLPLMKTARETHTIVNQQHTDLLAYQRDLKNALSDADVAIPRDQSRPNGDTNNAI